MKTLQVRPSRPPPSRELQTGTDLSVGLPRYQMWPSWPAPQVPISIDDQSPRSALPSLHTRDSDRAFTRSPIWSCFHVAMVTAWSLGASSEGLVSAESPMLAGQLSRLPSRPFRLQLIAVDGPRGKGGDSDMVAERVFLRGASRALWTRNGAWTGSLARTD